MSQKSQVRKDFLAGFRGSAISYFNLSYNDRHRITVSPSSFKRIVHELRKEHGRDIIQVERVKTATQNGTPYAVYYMP